MAALIVPMEHGQARQAGNRHRNTGQPTSNRIKKQSKKSELLTQLKFGISALLILNIYQKYLKNTLHGPRRD